MNPSLKYFNPMFCCQLTVYLTLFDNGFLMVASTRLDIIQN